MGSRTDVVLNSFLAIMIYDTLPVEDIIINLNLLELKKLGFDDG